MGGISWRKLSLLKFPYIPLLGVLGSPGYNSIGEVVCTIQSLELCSKVGVDGIDDKTTFGHRFEGGIDVGKDDEVWTIFHVEEFRFPMHGGFDETILDDFDGMDVVTEFNVGVLSFGKIQGVGWIFAVDTYGFEDLCGGSATKVASFLGSLEVVIEEGFSNSAFAVEGTNPDNGTMVWRLLEDFEDGCHPGTRLFDDALTHVRNPVRGTGYFVSFVVPRTFDTGIIFHNVEGQSALFKGLVGLDPERHVTTIQAATFKDSEKSFSHLWRINDPATLVMVFFGFLAEFLLEAPLCGELSAESYHPVLVKEGVVVVGDGERPELDGFTRHGKFGMEFGKKFFVD